MFTLPEKFLKPYNPTQTENKIYQKWLDDGFFNPDVCIKKGITDKKADTFSMVLPPPNVTGILHLGHAAMLTIEDTIIRYQRMQGKRTLWIPGTDHAAIATQVKVEKLLQKEGIRRHDLGRKKFLERVEKYAQESHDTIIEQIKKMGASLDWAREAFTLDGVRQKAVYTAFTKLYNDGLIIRGNRIVNWDPKGQTTVSDDEVTHEEIKGTLYYFKYSPEFPITIATTRPETKLGDTGVAVHPDDKRYKNLIGKTFNINFVGTPLEIKIVGDKDVDPKFGTGAVGVTPAHSVIDFEMSTRHNLPVKQVINEYARMEVDDEELSGKKTLEARSIIVERLKSSGLFEKEEEIDQNISKAVRTRGVIEPLPKLQWFVAVNKKFRRGWRMVTLKKLMMDAVKKKDIDIIPKRFERVYLNWINNLHDWCISRQIWYGHRIPVWYKGEKIHVGSEAPKEDGWTQDEDTLDTWFSSGLWTFSTLGWPDKTNDLETYHPTNLLETGYDIIFFWVAKMVLMSSYLIGKAPFKTVYLHGMIRDKQGNKMSKSLENSINPLDLSEKYGADAVRMSLMVGVGPGNDSNPDDGKVRAYKKFLNKVWNASRFVLENITDLDFEKIDSIELHQDDKKIMNELEEHISDITSDIENYRLYLASEKLYHYFWHTFADIIIESSKRNLENTERKKSTQKMLYLVLTNCLKALHPFTPFITEEIWESLPYKERDTLIVTKWPKVNDLK